MNPIVCPSDCSRLLSINGTRKTSSDCHIGRESSRGEGRRVWRTIVVSVRLWRRVGAIGCSGGHRSDRRSSGDSTIADDAGPDCRNPCRRAPARAHRQLFDAGDPEALYRWLTSDATKGADAFVLSSDMMVYGGLVASRIPGVPAWLGYSRLRFMTALRSLRPKPASFYGFGTVMRLAPTGVPAIGAAASFFAAGKAYELITQYANDPDPALGQRIGAILRYIHRNAPP